MKKIIVTAALAISTMGLFAQTAATPLQSKKGELYLPEAGDWAIGFSASPILTYLGQFLGNGPNPAPTAGFLNGNNTIIGKYFKDDHTAYRVLVRIGVNHTGQDGLIADQTYTGTGTPPMVTDHWSYSNHFVGLGAGMEMRRGKTRLQGYYGAEFMFYLSGSSNTYTYGNAFSSKYQNPPSTNFGSNIIGTFPTIRLTSSAPGSTFGINLLGFVGVEYFIIPKISLGAEFTWGVAFSSTGQGASTAESWDAVNNVDKSTPTNTGGSSTFGFDNAINSAFSTGSGALYLNFHF